MSGLRLAVLRPDGFPALARLFGPRGACGGCWCMYWRIGRGERWDEVKGVPARGRLQQLVEADRAHGVLAFDGDEPVGWCAFERRVELPRLQRAPSLRCEDPERVWSLPCFFVRADQRGRGVAGALLGAAVERLREIGAEIVEGYPAQPSRPGEKLPAAFAWTGTPALFMAAGFAPAAPRPRGKLRVRKHLRT